MVSKPCTMPVHPCGKFCANSVVYILAKEAGVRSLFIVHRIDRPTSGLLIMATSSVAAERFSRKLRDRLVQKHYVARVRGRFPGTADEVVSPYRREDGTTNPAGEAFLANAGKYFVCMPSLVPGQVGGQGEQEGKEVEPGRDEAKESDVDGGGDGGGDGSDDGDVDGSGEARDPRQLSKTERKALRRNRPRGEAEVGRIGPPPRSLRLWDGVFAKPVTRDPIADAADDVAAVARAALVTSLPIETAMGAAAGASAADGGLAPCVDNAAKLGISGSVVAPWGGCVEIVVNKPICVASRKYGCVRGCVW